MRALMRLLPERRAVISGKLAVDGQDVLALKGKELAAFRGGEAAMIFQEPMTALDPVYTVGHQIAETVRRHTGCSFEEGLARALELLELVKVLSAKRRLNAFPHELAGASPARHDRLGVVVPAQITFGRRAHNRP